MNDVHVTSVVLSQNEPIIPNVEVVHDHYIYWYCPGGEEDEQCGLMNMAFIDELEYQHPGQGQARGAVIALPKCDCGAQTFLKADYTLKELYKCLQVVSDEEHSAYVLPLRYVNNLHIHALLHERGKAKHAPILDMPPMEVVEQLAGVKYSTVAALWFGYSVVREYKPLQLTTRHILRIGG